MSRDDFSFEPGAIQMVENLSMLNCTFDRYIVTEVYKTGEKVHKPKRGPKPQGYRVYRNGLAYDYLPYGTQPGILVKKSIVKETP